MVTRRIVVARPLGPRRVDVIVNRVARNLAREGALLAAIRRAVDTAPEHARLHETRSLTDLDTVAQAIAARGTDCVLLAGGDGSYLAGTTALARAFGVALPPIGFAPGGTVSTVVRNWGFHGGASDYASRLVLSALAGTSQTTPRPTLAVRDDRGGDRVGFIFGAGLVSSFFDLYYEAQTPGYAAAARIVARVFVGSFTSSPIARRVLAPAACVLTVDGLPQPMKGWTLVTAGVVRDMGLHMHLLHRAGEDLGRFHTVASGLPAHLLGPQLPWVLLGRRLHGAGHVDALVRELRVDFERPSTYVLDGDRLVAKTVTVSPGPVLRFVAPPPRR